MSIISNLCSPKLQIWQVGSADHHIHYFDLRRPDLPLYVFNGHKKAVSYVKFLSPNELASASTDSTLRLWDVKENCAVCSECLAVSLDWRKSAENGMLLCDLYL